MIENDLLLKMPALNLSSNLYNLIDGLGETVLDKWELLSFVYEFVVNGRLIDVSKNNDSAIDKLYPICRSLRISKSTFLENDIVENF